MITLDSHPSPNPAQSALLREESGLTYEIVPVDTRRGEQHLPDFSAMAQNVRLAGPGAI